MDHIKEYWELSGKTHGNSHWASWGDNWMIDLEFYAINKYLKEGDNVLDVGCANGFATFRHNESCKLSSITGVDFADSMVKEAQKTKQLKSCNENIRFLNADVRSLNFENDTFDVVYTTRTLINLPNWNEQMQGIAECLRVTKPNGTVIFSEAFWEPLMLLNAFRSLKNLPTLVEHDFNKYLKLSSLEAHLKNMELNYQIEDFSSIYYLGSRFLRELVTDSGAYSGYSNPINKIFYEIEKQFSGGGMGVQQAVIIKK